MINIHVWNFCLSNYLQKEYARYKQMKGWKHLVVYKSGIHALGLYTSRFISRGEMVWPACLMKCKKSFFPSGLKA